MSSAMAEGRIRVLLVDDCRLIRQRLVESMVGLDGVEVVGEAANSQEGMELFQTLTPDVLIVDIKNARGKWVSIIRSDSRPRSRRQGDRANELSPRNIPQALYGTWCRVLLSKGLGIPEDRGTVD